MEFLFFKLQGKTLTDDRCSVDLKSVGWRDDSNSPSPSASDSGSMLSSSNSSIIGDDMSSPRNIISASLVTTIILNSNTYAQNGHKKLNRSQSEPRGRSKHSNSGGLSSSRYKTELCHPFEENGVCKYGEKCQFAHGFHELRDLARHPKYKTELCRTFHAEGYCPYGARCHFIHEERSLAKGKPSSLCLFSPAAAALGCHGGSGPILSASSVKDLSMSPNSLSSLSPASSTNAFSFAAGPIYSPPPSPIEARLPIFNEISAPTPLFPVGRQFGGGLTA
ncbi:hypothetical protein V9T40_007058 [Parthenolecanium corni]|uniref:C3H1-type domain-containing protein n=1 Tax=Parthenolecanium corni TaxID=536013 RepID=A0AAN9TY37_9HEMI